MRYIRALTVLSAVLLTACEENFSPNAPFVPKMVVYSFLRSDSDTQMVRVYSTYNPAENNPSNNTDEIQVSDAQVSFVQGSTSYQLRDTVIERGDKSRYTSDILMYYITPFRPQNGKAYTLNVFSPTYGTVVSNVVVPDSGRFTLIGSDFLKLYNPWSTGSFVARGTLAPQTAAYIVRLYLYFLTDTPQGTVEKRVEVPRKLGYFCEGPYEIFEPTFPSIIQKSVSTSNFGVGFEAGAQQITVFNTVKFEFNVRYLRAVITLTQFDAPLYEYYTFVNQYRDRVSVQSNEAEYSNIQGGIGVFGSMTVDSTVIPLPQYIYGPEPRCVKRIRR